MDGREPAALLETAAAGDRGALARLVSHVERGGEAARLVDRLTVGRGSPACTVGITGAPGAGKSTLASRLVEVVRRRGQEVAVLAVDPSSPFTGGAILGDRVRMGEHGLDGGVFIRSMASRGELGGVAAATAGALRVLEAAGFPVVLVETVGVGQVEVAVAAETDTTVVVVNPGWGDSVQANKAGLLEVADVFVINKADRPGADRTEQDLDEALSLATRPRRRPAVVRAVATEGKGTDEVWAAVEDHRRDLEADGGLARRRALRAGHELRRAVARRIEQRAGDLCRGEAFDRVLHEVAERRLDPWSAADALLEGGR